MRELPELWMSRLRRDSQGQCTQQSRQRLRIARSRGAVARGCRLGKSSSRKMSKTTAEAAPDTAAAKSNPCMASQGRREMPQKCTETRTAVSQGQRGRIASERWRQPEIQPCSAKWRRCSRCPQRVRSEAARLSRTHSQNGMLVVSRSHRMVMAAQSSPASHYVAYCTLRKDPLHRDPVAWSSLQPHHQLRASMRCCGAFAVSSGVSQAQQLVQQGSLC